MKLDKYELTEKGARCNEIILPANGKGDSLFKLRTASLNDNLAALLLARKDGKGAEYVQKKKKAPEIADLQEPSFFKKKKKESTTED